MRKILDIGCGTGFRTHVLSKKRNSNVIGIDISKENISICKKRYPQVTFEQMSAEKLGYKNNAFDEIYAIDVLEHVDNLNKVLSEVRRVLKVSGRLITIIPAEKSEKWLLKLRPTYHREIHHVRIFKKNELEDILKRKSFDVLSKKSKGFLEHFELYYFFKTHKKSSSQIQIGKWDANFLSVFIHAVSLSCDPYWVFNTPLKFIPTWFITIPIGFLVNFFGNKKMPKSIYLEFVKIR